MTPIANRLWGQKNRFTEATYLFSLFEKQIDGELLWHRWCGADDSIPAVRQLKDRKYQSANPIHGYWSPSRKQVFCFSSDFFFLY